MRTRFALLIFFAFSKPVWAAPDDPFMVLSGTRDAVLSVLERAFRADVPNGALSPTNGSIGYEVQWYSVVTGPTQLSAVIRPMAKKGSVEPTAFNVSFFYRTRTGDGRFHIQTLKPEIAKQADAANSGVRVVPEQESTGYMPLRKLAEECFAGLRSDSDLAAISDKVSLSGSDSSLMMMANDSKATPEDAKVIALWASKRDTCGRMLRTDADYFPGNQQAGIVIAGLDSMNRLLVGLYKGTLSYGEFAQRRTELTGAARQQDVDIAKERATSEAKAKEAEHQRQLQQQAINAANTKAAMEMLKPAPVPTMPAIQPPINCTSRAVGGAINTQCQ